MRPNELKILSLTWLKVCTDLEGLGANVRQMMPQMYASVLGAQLPLLAMPKLSAADLPDVLQELLVKHKVRSQAMKKPDVPL
jgi:hypothetical protein